MQYIDRAAVPSKGRFAPHKTLFVMALTFIFGTGPVPVWAQAKGVPKTNNAAKPDPKAKKNQPLEFTQPDPDKLPPGFTPAPEPIAMMDLEQPITTKDELARLKKEVSGKFSRVLRDCDQSSAGKQIVEASIRYRLGEMTLRDKRKDLPDLHKTLMREITNGIGTPGIKPADVASMTQYVNSEIVKQIPELLVNNFYVRLHAVLILSELDYVPAHSLLLQVLQGKDPSEDPIKGQPQSIKIAAAQGLIRILKFTSPSVAQKTTIAKAIVDELQKPQNHWWYQMRLIEGLRNMTVSVDAGNNKPFVIDALLAVIKDPKREWVVRARACHAIGRVPIPAGVNPNDVVTAIADFALQMSNAAQAKPNNPHWKGSFWDVYLAFKPDGSKDKDGKEKDLDAEKKISGGLLARSKASAQPAYEVIVPIVRDVLHGKPPAAADVKSLNDFVQSRSK